MCYFKFFLLGQSATFVIYLFFYTCQGLIALLAVVDALSNVDGLEELNKQVGLSLSLSSFRACR